jgi:hypothetical protein
LPRKCTKLHFLTLGAGEAEMNNLAIRERELLVVAERTEGGDLVMVCSCGCGYQENWNNNPRETSSPLMTFPPCWVRVSFAGHDVIVVHESGRHGGSLVLNDVLPEMRCITDPQLRQALGRILGNVLEEVAAGGLRPMRKGLGLHALGDGDHFTISQGRPGVADSCDVDIDAMSPGEARAMVHREGTR